MAMNLYDLPSSTGWLVAKHDDGSWSIFPAIADGWSQRRDWNPSPAYANRIETEDNGIELIHRAELLEIPHQLRWFGIDPSMCASTRYLQEMAGEAFRAARESLGLTQKQLAAVMGYGAKARIGEIEGRRGAVPAQAARLMRAYLTGYRPDDWPR